jgi:hypothetical protein
MFPALYMKHVPPISALFFRFPFTGKATFIYFHNVSFVTVFAYITSRNLIKIENEHSLFYFRATE